MSTLSTLNTDPGLATALLDSLLVLSATGIALWLRPWRLIAPGRSPWPAFALWAALPVLWSLGVDSATGPLPQISGAVLLLMMAGWPLAVLGLAVVAVLLAAGSVLSIAQALHHLVWLGLLPATLALAIGAAVRLWLPRLLFGYLLGRAFVGTWLALLLPAWVALALQSVPDWQPMAVAQLLVAFGEASLTGSLVTLMVALRPAWLATYADRLYLRPGERAPA